MSELYTPTEFCITNGSLLREIVGAADGWLQPGSQSYIAAISQNLAEPLITHGIVEPADIERELRSKGTSEPLHPAEMADMAASNNLATLERIGGHVSLTTAHLRYFADTAALDRAIDGPVGEDAIVELVRPTTISYARCLVGDASPTEVQRTSMVSAPQYDTATLHSFATKVTDDNLHTAVCRILTVDDQLVEAGASLVTMDSHRIIARLAFHAYADTALWVIETSSSEEALEVDLTNLRNQVDIPAAFEEWLTPDIAINAMRRYGLGRLATNAMERQFEDSDDDSRLVTFVELKERIT